MQCVLGVENSIIFIPFGKPISYCAQTSVVENFFASCNIIQTENFFKTSNTKVSSVSKPEGTLWILLLSYLMFKAISVKMKLFDGYIVAITSDEM